MRLRGFAISRICRIRRRIAAIRSKPAPWRIARSCWPGNWFVPLSEFALRRAGLQRQMAENKLDAFVAGFGPNVRYLTGFTGSNGMLLVLPERAMFLTDPRYRIQAAQEVDCPVRVVSGPMLPHVVALLRRTKSKRVGFEKARMSVESYQGFKDAMPMRTSPEPVAGWIERQRTLK